MNTTRIEHDLLGEPKFLHTVTFVFRHSAPLRILTLRASQLLIILA